MHIRELVTFNNSHWQHDIFEVETIEMSSLDFQPLLGTRENANNITKRGDF